MQDVQDILPTGSIVQDRYQVEALLGKGGFGAVYLVRDLRVRSNLFALKVVADPHPKELVHFTFEADLLKRADHPSLPRVYRVFDDIEHNRAYMLMDYIEGTNLEQLRKQPPDKRFPLSQVLAFMGPIMEAVSYLHVQKPPIIHRDIKPSNIIVPDSGERTMLVDLGIAKEFEMDATTSAIRHASPGYGAPEQYTRGTNPRTDVYGLGATLYTLLTGSVPVEAFYRLTQQAAKNIDPLAPANQLVPEIPAYIAQAIQRAMALEIDDRFATVDDFWQALTTPAEAPALGATLPVTISRMPTVVTPKESASVVYHPTGPVVPVTRRKRGRVLLVALVAILLSGIVAFALVPGLLSHHPSTASTTPVGQRPTAAPTRTHTSATAAPTSAPTSAPAPSPTQTQAVSGIPTLASTYNGQIHDQNPNDGGSVTATMSLNSIIQQGQHIQGNFVVGSGLNGSGPFTGTVDANNNIQFTVPSEHNNAPLLFQGKVNRDGSMNGSYCSLDANNQCNPTSGGHGTWNVQPASSGSGSGSSSIFREPRDLPA